MNKNNKQNDTDLDSAQDRKVSYWMMAVAVLAGAASSVIAFCCTCFPIGYVMVLSGGITISEERTPQQEEQNDLLFFWAYGIGIAVGATFAYFVIRTLLKSWKNK